MLDELSQMTDTTDFWIIILPKRLSKDVCLIARVFMQDGDTVHKTRRVNNVIQANFCDECAILRTFLSSKVNRSELLWLQAVEFIKDRAYWECVTNEVDLKSSIIRYVSLIPTNKLRTAVDSTLLAFCSPTVYVHWTHRRVYI